MSPTTRTPDFDRYQEIVQHGLLSLAWEFMRRDTEYRTSWRKAGWRKAGWGWEHYETNDVALRFGLEKLKHPDEWYFDGERPRFTGLQAVTYAFKNAEPGQVRERSVRLAPGHVAIAFDLNSDVETQLKLAGFVLKAKQASWVARNKVDEDEIRERLPPTHEKNLLELASALQAYDMIKNGSKLAEVGERFKSLAPPSGDPKGTGRKLRDLADRMVAKGGYRLLILRGLVEQSEAELPKQPRRAPLNRKSEARSAEAKQADALEIPDPTHVKPPQLEQEAAKKDVEEEPELLFPIFKIIYKNPY